MVEGKYILITGAARRIGQVLAITAAKAGANIILHHSDSPDEAQEVADEIRQLKKDCRIIRADFSNPQKAIEVIGKSVENLPVYALVNNAAIFEPVNFNNTSLFQWQTHIDINLTVPFLLSQLLAVQKNIGLERIINIVDWRALRPGKDHFPYTICKAGLVAMTQAMAVALAPQIQVNALALGAILPPTDGRTDDRIISTIPMGRSAKLEELSQAFLFLLKGPAYMTGEIIHLDGGRHLV